MSKLVYIAAGHGGPKDPGAVSDGMIEKNINLKVALFLRDYLKDYDCDIKMSRVADTPAPTIVERCAEAARLKATCFIEIHHNGGGGVGGEAFFWHSDKKARELAALTAQEFSKIGQRLRSVSGYPAGAKPSGKDGVRNFGVCRINAGNGIPAILGEFAFLDSAADRAKIDTDAKLKKEAEAYGRAVVEFLGLIKKEAPKLPPTPVATKYKVLTSLVGYRTADDAKNGRNKASVVAAGHYFVFREYGGMVNVTKVSGSPGSWINPKDNKVTPAVQTPAPAPVPTPAPAPAPKKLVAGSPVDLISEPLYVSASARVAVRRVTGTYYIYSVDEVNGRIRITNSAKKAGKSPAGWHTTGWIETR